jgi:glycyl-tRNA synthetase
MNECKGSFMCFYEEKDAIGKRYRRMDAIGTAILRNHRSPNEGRQYR